MIITFLWFIPIFALFSWVLSLVLKDASIADILWGLGFIILAWTAFLLFGRSILVPILVSIWGLRLAIHIYSRNRKSGPDFRYENFRLANPSNWWWRSFFKVSLLQSTLLWICALSVIWGSNTVSYPPKFELAFYLGLATWIIGFGFETVADYQLSRFKSDPNNKGKVLDTGLWSLSRHPNYFGEFVLWWGIFLIAISNGTGYWTIISPLLISFLLLRVSGVTMLEMGMKERKPGYADYIESTPAFFPSFRSRKS